MQVSGIQYPVSGIRHPVKKIKVKPIFAENKIESLKMVDTAPSTSFLIGVAFGKSRRTFIIGEP